MSKILDIFKDDAFSLSSLTAQINNIDHVPGAAGERVFAGVSKGIPVDTVSIERIGEELTLIQTGAREAPAEQERESHRNLIGIESRHIMLEQTIHAHEIMGTTIAGSWGKDGYPPTDDYGDRLRGARSVVTQQMNKMVRRHDLTLEHHRLGALKGIVKDADGSTLVDLFTVFGFLKWDPLESTCRHASLSIL